MFPSNISSFLCFCLILLAWVVNSFAQEIQSKCEMNRRGDSGELICFFNKDMSKEKHNFIVQRYELNGDNPNYEPVLECHWLIGVDTPECKTLPGYTFNNKVSLGAAIWIEHITKSHEGRYLCQFTSANGPKKEEFCHYIHSESPAPPTATTPSSAELSSASEKENRKDQDDKSQPFIIAVIYVSLTLAATIVIVFVVLYALKRKQARHNKEDEERQHDQNNAGQSLIETSDETSSSIDGASKNESINDITSSNNCLTTSHSPIQTTQTATRTTREAGLIDCGGKYG